MVVPEQVLVEHGLDLRVCRPVQLLVVVLGLPE